MICDAKYWQVDAPQNAAQQVFPTCPLPGPCPAAAENTSYACVKLCTNRKYLCDSVNDCLY